MSCRNFLKEANIVSLKRLHLLGENRFGNMLKDAEENFEREMNKLRSTSSEVIQSWISNQG